MSWMKEIEVKDLIKYINPFELNVKPAIAIASDGKETNGLTIGWAGFSVLWRKLQSMYIKHVTLNIFSIMLNIILYVLWIKNIKIN
jgi:hypothetical protein